MPNFDDEYKWLDSFQWTLKVEEMACFLYLGLHGQDKDPYEPVYMVDGTISHFVHEPYIVHAHLAMIHMGYRSQGGQGLFRHEATLGENVEVKSKEKGRPGAQTPFIVTDEMIQDVGRGNRRWSDSSKN